MTVRNWKAHSSRILLAVLVVLFIGWMLGHVVLVSGVALLCFGSWQLFNALRLHSWLKNTDQDVPESYGAWADIFDQIRSITRQRQQQEKQYKTMIAEFQSLTNALPDPTLVLDAQKNITWCNDSAISLLGLRIPEDLGQAVTNLLRGPEFSQWLTEENRNNSRLEMASPLNDDRWWHVTSVPFQLDQQLIVLRDITDLHNVEQIRRDFVANVSHELRTPVTVLLGYLELLDQHPEEEVSAAVSRMHSQTLQMKALLDDLLELSRLQSDELQGHEETVDIPALIGQLKEQAEEISRGNHMLVFDAEPGLRLVGNAADLASAFRNLITNAIRYTPAGGRIEVRWLDSEDGPRFSVKDSGIGIPKRDLPRLTERFYRVGSGRGRKSGGTGLGLAIVKHIMNAHEAKLIIRSELGEGSEFICQFTAERRIEGELDLNA